LRCVHEEIPRCRRGNIQLAQKKSQTIIAEEEKTFSGKGSIVTGSGSTLREVDTRKKAAKLVSMKADFRKELPVGLHPRGRASGEKRKPYATSGETDRTSRRCSRSREGRGASWGDGDGTVKSITERSHSSLPRKTVPRRYLEFINAVGKKDDRDKMAGRGANLRCSRTPFRYSGFLMMTKKCRCREGGIASKKGCSKKGQVSLLKGQREKKPGAKNWSDSLRRVKKSRGRSCPNCKAEIVLRKGGLGTSI